MQFTSVITDFMHQIRYCFVFFVLPFLFLNCKKDKTEKTKYHTENVVVIVVDGPRYSETWGAPNQELIPHMKNDMAPEGVVFTNFSNNGPTYTTAGHTAILTGHYQEINNGGAEIPRRPNYLQYWLKDNAADPTKAWFIASKDKIEPLSNCMDSLWRDRYIPSTDCGKTGLGSGYRSDSLTVVHILDSMERHHPNLVFINFRQPDVLGHTGVWEDYIAAIEQVDAHYFAIWQYLKNSAHYQDNTTLFITNDHGRHSDEAGSFAGHGDSCEGCRHINLFAAGPDFKSNVINSNPYELIDISITLSELLGFEMPTSEGRLIKDLFHE
jgi:arylsulfatase A-like enzyme